MNSKRYVALKPFNNKIYYRNGLFDEKVSIHALIYIRLKKYLETRSVILNTSDIKTDSIASKIYFDMPYPFELAKWLRLVTSTKKPILFAFEPPIVNPFNYMKLLHSFFRKVYTWNDKLVDNKMYFKFFFPNILEKTPKKELAFGKKKLLVFVNTNWLPILPFELMTKSKELYTERIKIINFFEEKARDEFDLFGKGWNMPQKFSLKQKLLGYKKYESYKGPLEYRDKVETLSKYKFCITFENSRVPGYISEKIFDCFKAKCVPIYFGAPNINKYISKGCYIDFSDYENYDQLLDHIRSMTENEYKRYLERADNLMNDKGFIKRWSENGFCETFYNAINE